jgi:Carboxypeptidase regulatory-like domain
MKIARTRSLLILVIAAALGLFLLIAANKLKSPASKTQSTEASQIQTGIPSIPPSQKTLSDASSPTGAEKSEAGFRAAFKTPIAFYGRVVDQYNNPIPQATVKLSANDKSFGGRPSEYRRQTDTEGRFSIDGIAGITLAVEVSKPGYRGIPRSEGRQSSSGLFEYSVSDASVHGPYRPDKDKPTVFVLYKPGSTETLVTVGERTFHISRDGSPLSISLDQKNTHNVILRCWTNDVGRPAGQQKYDWRFEIDVPNGGLVLRNDSFDLEAPEGGYIPSDTVNMPASLPFGHGGWSGLAERSYFLRFNDGIFARVDLQMHAGGDHFVVWESYLNPEPGHRNLEFDPAKQADVK